MWFPECDSFIWSQFRIIDAMKALKRIFRSRRSRADSSQEEAEERRSQDSEDARERAARRGVRSSESNPNRGAVRSRSASENLYFSGPIPIFHPDAYPGSHNVINSSNLVFSSQGPVVLVRGPFPTQPKPKHVGMDPSVLPCFPYFPSECNPSSADESTQETPLYTCSICMGTYDEGEMLRLLPCLHRYHQECIDPWLLQNSLCPLCNQDVRKLINDANDVSHMLD